MTRLLRILTGALLLALPLAASAQGIEQAINSVGGTLPTVGGQGFVYLAFSLFTKVRPILTGVAVFVVVLMGFKMIVAQEDDAVSKARVQMTAVVSGMILLYLIEPFINAFYGTTGEIFRGNMAGGATIVNTQVNGLINWGLTIVGSLAVTIMIVSAFRAILKGTGEEGITLIRKTAGSVAAGIILLVFRGVLAANFINSPASPIPLLTPLFSIISYVLTFLALAAVVVIIFSAISLILSLGNDEKLTQMKGLLMRTIVGFIIIVMSLSIVKFVIMPGVS
jgi:hypothetical protein